MKIKVIRTYDKGIFETELSNMYKDNSIKDVQTHTESHEERGHFLIYYIAIVFYYPRYGEGLVKELGLTNRTSNALWIAGIETVDQLKEAMYNGRIKRVRNLGKVSMEEIEAKLEQL